MTAEPSRTEIDKGCAQVAQAVERALRDAQVQPRRLAGLKFDFAEGWLPLPALHELAGNGDDPAALQLLEEALRHHDDILSAALMGTGIPKMVVDLLRNWMAVQMGARLALVEAAAATAIRRVPLPPGKTRSKRKR